MLCAVLSTSAVLSVQRGRSVTPPSITYPSKAALAHSSVRSKLAAGLGRRQIQGGQHRYHPNELEASNLGREELPSEGRPR